MYYVYDFIVIIKVEFDIDEVDKVEVEFDFVDFDISHFCRTSTVADSFDFVEQLSNDN